MLRRNGNPSNTIKRMNYRQANNDDLEKMRSLALKSWNQFEKELTEDNWKKLSDTVGNRSTYIQLVNTSYSVLCETDDQKIVGMAFLVPSGNPTEIYDEKWSYIRLVSVDPDYSGKGIGKQLTMRCIEEAKNTKEQIIALHTSEMMNAARYIYESLGFKVLKELNPRLGKRYWLYTLTIA